MALVSSTSHPLPHPRPRHRHTLPFSFCFFFVFLPTCLLSLAHAFTSNTPRHVLSLPPSSSSSRQQQSQSQSQPQLLFVAELCRHGDRTPLGESPTDALPLSQWPAGPGQLTPVGQRAHFDLGTRLRSRYITATAFLPPSYDRTSLYVRSTDIDRTLMSAQSQLMGLYPPGTASLYDVRQRFENNVNNDIEIGLPNRLQPIPIHTVPSSDDMMLLPGANCPRHAQLMSTKLFGAEYAQKVKDNEQFISQVAALAGFLKNTSSGGHDDDDGFTLHHFERVVDNWVCFSHHGVPLPHGVTPDVFARARNLSDWLLDFVNRGKEVHRLRAGLTLNFIREHMLQAFVSASASGNHDSTSTTSDYKKFVLLSAHDTTVAATLAAMGVFDGKYPPYNSTILWELWRNGSSSSGNHKDGLFVRVEYNDRKLIIPGCDSVDCPLHTYLTATKGVTIYGGEQQRATECLTGPRRLLATLFGRGGHGTYGHASEEAAAGSGLKGVTGGASGGMSTIALATVVAALVTAGVVAVARWRARYYGYGYVFAGSDGMGSGRGGTGLGDLDKDVVVPHVDRITNQRILM